MAGEPRRHRLLGPSRARLRPTASRSCRPTVSLDSALRCASALLREPSPVSDFAEACDRPRLNRFAVTSHRISSRSHYRRVPVTDMRLDLVERAKGGDREAFGQLAAGEVDRLHAIARLVLRDPDLAEDAVQEALVRCWRQLPKLRDVERFDGWLYRILMRAAADEHGRRRRHETTVQAIGMEPAVTDGAGSLADRDELEPASGASRSTIAPSSSSITTSASRSGGRGCPAHPARYGEVALPLRDDGPARGPSGRCAQLRNVGRSWHERAVRSRTASSTTGCAGERSATGARRACCQAALDRVAGVGQERPLGEGASIRRMGSVGSPRLHWAIVGAAAGAAAARSNCRCRSLAPHARLCHPTERRQRLDCRLREPARQRRPQRSG